MGALRVPGARWPLAVRVGFAASTVWLVLHELHTLLVPGLDVGPLFSRYAHDVLLLVAAGLSFAGGWRRRGAERVAWMLISAGVLAWALGEDYYTVVLWTNPDPPLPSPADAAYLLSPPLILIGAIVLLRTRARGVPRRRWLDGLTAALSVSA